MSALENYELGDDTADEIDDTPPIPNDIDEADWQLRRLGRLRRRMAENEALAGARIALARKWLQEENGKLERHAAFFEQSLAAFHAHLLDEDPKRKSISLPAGTLKARKHPDSVVVLDADQFVAWAIEERPELVRTKVEPNKSEIKRLLAVGQPFADNGEVLGHLLVDPATGVVARGVCHVAGEISFTADADHKEVGE